MPRDVGPREHMALPKPILLADMEGLVGMVAGGHQPWRASWTVMWAQQSWWQ